MLSLAIHKKKVPHKSSKIRSIKWSFLTFTNKKSFAKRSAHQGQKQKDGLGFVLITEMTFLNRMALVGKMWCTILN